MTNLNILESMLDPFGPEKVVVVSDRRSSMRGVLVIDNTARGMGKGGTRMAANLTVHEVARLARTMTWKWAANDLFFGGAKAGIAADPTMPRAQRERVIRSFARALSNEIPREYVFGLDMGLSEDDAAVVVDELGTFAASVGTPNSLGGFPYDELGVTGFGVAEALDAAAVRQGFDPAATTVAIQGFGAVGRAAAERLDELGYRIVAVSTTAGGLHDPAGLEIADLATRSRATGDSFVLHVPGVSQLPSGAELTVQADILAPCATQDVIDLAVARDVTASLVVEGANMPTTADARAYLHDRGVTFVPDIIANAGGGIAAAHAMDTRMSARPADRAEIFADIRARIRANTDAVLDAASAEGLPPHEAAWGLAQARVRAAMQSRGQDVA